MDTATGATMPPIPGRQRETAELWAISHLCMLSLALLLVFPLAALALAGALLINLPAHTPRYARIMLALIASMSFSMMMGARPLDPSASNDIDVYHEIYAGIAGGDYSYLQIFADGWEFTLPLVFYVWGRVLPALSPNGLMFCMAFSGMLVIMFWVERTFYARRDRARPEIMGIVLLMVNLAVATQLSRQFLASAVLLLAFTAQSRARQLLFVALAASIHLTAIPFFGLFLLARRGPKGWAVILLLVIGLRVFFSQLLTAFDVVPAALVDKIAYYTNNDQEFTVPDILAMRILGLLAAISLLVVAVNGFKPPRAAHYWLAAPWLTLAVHVLLLPIPLASMRTTLMVHAVAAGVVTGRMLQGSARRWIFVVLNVVFVYKIYALATTDNSGNLLTSMKMFEVFLP